MVEIREELISDETEFYLKLLEYEGREICLAGFKTVFRNTPGLAFWADGKLIAYFTASPKDTFDSCFDHPELEIEMIRSGLRIQPTERIEFARALADGEQIRRHARSAGEIMISLFASHPADQRALRQRLWMIWRHDRKAAVEWADNFPNQATPPQSLLAAARRVFDFPGFPAPDDGRMIDFAMLLPTTFRDVEQTADVTPTKGE